MNRKVFLVLLLLFSLCVGPSKEKRIEELLERANEQLDMCSAYIMSGNLSRAEKALKRAIEYANKAKEELFEIENEELEMKMEIVLERIEEVHKALYLKMLSEEMRKDLLEIRLSLLNREFEKTREKVPELEEKLSMFEEKLGKVPEIEVVRAFLEALRYALEFLGDLKEENWGRLFKEREYYLNLIEKAQMKINVGKALLPDVEGRENLEETFEALEETVKGIKKDLEDELYPYLAAANYVDENIVKIASEFTGTRETVVRDLYRWVQENIEVSEVKTLRLPSKVLDARSGCEEEIVVLLASLLKAAGIRSVIFLGQVDGEKKLYLGAYIAEEIPTLLEPYCKSCAFNQLSDENVRLIKWKDVDYLYGWLR